MYVWASPTGARGKKPACQFQRHKRHGFEPSIGKILWRRASQPTPVFLPGESYGQRSLEGYSSQVAKSRTQLKRLSTHACIYIYVHIKYTYVGDQKHNYISFKSHLKILNICLKYCDYCCF